MTEDTQNWSTPEEREAFDRMPTLCPSCGRHLPCRHHADSAADDGTGARRMTTGRPTLMVCTPCYSGSLSVEYVNSLLGLQAVAASVGLDTEVDFLHGQGAVTIARNTLVADFMESGRSHMLFVDDDIGFDPRAPLELLSHGAGVVAADYPKKALLLDRAVGRSFHTPDALLGAVTMGNARGVSGEGRLVEVDYIGTGFMMIAREALLRIAEANPGIAYTEGGRLMHAFFDCSLEDGAYFSEDYSFCRLARASGVPVMLDRSVRLTHAGRYVFRAHG